MKLSLSPVLLGMLSVAGAALPLPVAANDPVEFRTAEAAPDTAVDAIARTFFEKLKTGGGLSATTYIASLSSMYDTKRDQLTLMATQIDGATKLYGPIKSWEAVRREALGTLVRHEDYMVQHDNIVIRWRLYFERTPKGWTIASFDFGDQVNQWF